jgi:glycosyltransferase involved in cell wall biosynthesis
VSVVVPVFRTEEYLERCLSSVLRQTFSDFEVIVVDDASPVGGAAGIVDAIGDGRVEIIRHTRNLGVTQARSSGVHVARGGYVSFVDSDDEVEDRFLEVLHDAAKLHGADMVQCGLQQVEVDGTSWYENRGGARHELQADQVRRAMLAGKLSNSLGNKLVSTELVLSVFDDASECSRRVDYGEDLLTLFNLIDRVDRFAHVPDPVYRYLRRATSITVRSDADVLMANVKSLSEVLDRILPTLARWGEPPELVERFFAREFLVPVVGLLELVRAQGVLGPSGSSVSAAELGLLGAVVADAYGLSGLRAETQDHPSNGEQ